MHEEELEHAVHSKCRGFVTELVVLYCDSSSRC
jgi:hypothetical protein